MPVSKQEVFSPEYAGMLTTDLLQSSYYNILRCRLHAIFGERGLIPPLIGNAQEAAIALNRCWDKLKVLRWANEKNFVNAVSVQLLSYGASMIVRSLNIVLVAHLLACVVPACGLLEDVTCTQGPGRAL